MQCPKCSQAMVEQVDHGIKVDRCASCGSIWLDAGEMTAYLETTMSKGLRRKSVRPAAWEHDPEGPACPGCGKVRLSRGEWENVEFRACRRCRGFWLEGKALHMLATMSRSSPRLRLRDSPNTADDWAAGILDFLGNLAVGVVQGPHSY